MKNDLNRELIEALSENENKQFLDNINEKVYALVESALEDISLKSPFVNVEKCILVPANEVATGAIAQLSEFSYFLGIDNPEIEINSKRRKNFWKYIWREFKASWRIGRKKYKKSKSEPITHGIDKYKLSDFRHDLLLHLVNYLTETTIVSEYKNKISIVGTNDFGTNIQINLYVCCYDSATDSFKLYNESKNKFLMLSFGNRFSNLENKLQSAGESFLQMIRIFNSLYSRHYNKIPNQILIESMLYNCPDLLFSDDLYKTFVNIANYVRLANPLSVVSICDESKTIFDDTMIIKNGTQIEFGRMINVLDRFKF